MPEHSWSYQTIEIKPSFMGSFDVETINEVLAREGLNGWELVSTLNVGPMRPIFLFLKSRAEMRSWIVVGIGSLLAVGFALSHWMRVTTNPGALPLPPLAQEAALDTDLARRAEKFLDLLDAQNSEEALAMTTPEMVKALGDGKLEGIWQALPIRLGQRLSRGEPRGQEIGGHDVVAERLQFKDVALDARVVFDQHKRIAGFHLVPTSDTHTGSAGK